MQIIAEFMNNVQWYHPTTDTDDWAYFLATIQLGGQTPSLLGEIVGIARGVTQLQPGEDVAMWDGIISQFGQFAAKYENEPPSSPLTDAMQYDYVRCFLNIFWNAAHNEDLWESMNDTAQSIMNRQLQ